MSRKSLICLVILGLILQGVTVASADVLPASQMQHHCDGHEMSGEACDCCADDLVSGGGGCASFCVLAAALPVQILQFPPPPGSEPHRLVDQGVADPAYLPLNPPPIS